MQSGYNTQGTLIDYKAYIPGTDSTETSLNICSSEMKEYRMIFSGFGTTTLFQNWYLTLAPPTAYDVPIHSGYSLLLNGGQVPVSTGESFYLVAEAYTDPGQPFEERTKHGKVLQLSATCAGSPPGNGTAEPCDETDPTSCAFPCPVDQIYDHGCECPTGYTYIDGFCIIQYP